MRIKVLHIITHLNIGGAQDNTLITVENLDRKKYNVALLCGPGEEWLPRARQAGISIIILPELVRRINLPKDLVALIKIYRIIRREKYAVVHTHSSKPGFSGRIAGKMAGVPVVIHTIHGFPFHDFMQAPVRKGFILLERILSLLADRLITVSRLNLEKAVHLKLNKRKKFINIYSGINFSRFDGSFDLRETRRLLGAESGDKVVGMVGRLSRQKDPLTFIRAASIIQKDFPGVRFIIVGDGELRETVEAAARSLGVDKFKIMGFREDVPRLLSGFDVFVLSSLWEGLGRSLTEALYMSRPVVATAVEGVPELIENGRTGILVPPADPDAIAEAVERLLSEPKEAAIMGRAAREHVLQRFESRYMVEQIDKLYRSLLAEKGQLKKYV